MPLQRLTNSWIASIVCHSASSVNDDKLSDRSLCWLNDGAFHLVYYQDEDKQTLENMAPVPGGGRQAIYRAKKQEIGLYT